MKGRFQFSLWHFMMATIAIGLMVSLLAGIYVRQRADARHLELVFPIISQHNASVRVRNGNIVWLDGDAESKPYDGLLTIAEINDAGYGTSYRGANLGTPFNDAALAQFVKRHEAIEVLDIRGTGVSPAGLGCLETMSELRWLFVDTAHCDAVGLEHIRRLSSLQRLMVDGELAAEIVESLRQSIGLCEVRTRMKRTVNGETRTTEN